MTQSNFFSYSITESASEKAFNFLTVDQEHDIFPKRFSKLTVGLVAFTGIALIGVIETVVRHLLFFSAKGLQHFISEKHADFYNQNFYLPISHSTAMTTQSTIRALAKLVTNFLNTKNRKEVDKNINNIILNNYLV